MNKRCPASLLLGAFLYIVCTGSASALVCGAITDSQRIEAGVGLALEDFRTGGSMRHIERAITRVGENADMLVEFNVTDPVVADAVNAYATSAQTIRNQMVFLGPEVAAAIMMAEDHKWSMRFMILLGDEYCALNTPPTTSQTPDEETQNLARQIKNSLPALNIGWSAPAGLLSIFLVGGLAFLVARRSQVRKARQQRHYCNVTVEVISDKKRLTTKMIDISAIGAKVGIQNKVALATNLTLWIGDISIVGKCVWQNANFAGIVFKKPISLRQVHSLSKGKMERYVPPKPAAHPAPT